LGRATSSLGFAGMHSVERLAELANHGSERLLQGRSAADQDIIVATAHAFHARKPHQFA